MIYSTNYMFPYGRQNIVGNGLMGKYFELLRNRNIYVTVLFSFIFLAIDLLKFSFGRHLNEKIR